MLLGCFMGKISKKEVKRWFFSMLMYWGIGGAIGVGTNSLFYNYRTYRQNQEFENELNHEINRLKERDYKIGELPIYFPLSNPEEMLLSNNAVDAIEEISSRDLSSVYADYDQRYFDFLDIHLGNLKEAYGKYHDLSSPWHYNSSYYKRVTNEIDWEGLALHIYENGVEEAKDDEQVEAFSLPEVEEKIRRMRDLFMIVSEDFPEFSVAELACKLEDYQFFYRVDTLMEGGYQNLANTYYNKTIYSKREENDSEEDIRATDYHEDFHIFVNSCIDKILYSDVSRNNGGIHIASPSESCYSKVKGDCFTRYYYSFLEEIYAELYSAQCQHKNQDTYTLYDESLDVIQLVLAMDDGYSVDAILEDLVYQHPISFLRHFPNYGEDKENYLVNTCQMLKSFDLLLEANPAYFDYLLEQGLDQREGISHLKIKAFSQLSSLFFNRLIVMNDTYSSSMTLEDNFAMIELFDCYLQKANLAINYHLSLMECDVPWETGMYDSSYLADKEVFFHYLSKEYNREEADLYQEYVDHEEREDYTFPMFDSEKKKYYQALFEARNHDIFDLRSISLEIPKKSYSLQLK